jgi:phosphoglycerate dehydrogenase-like enzyme
VTLTVTVCAPLSLDAVSALSPLGGGTVEDVEIVYPADLLPRQRFPADHRGEPGFTRSAADEARWRSLLARTDVALGFPGDSPEGVVELFSLAPRLRWVQGTAAGTGELLAGSGLAPEVLTRVAVTSTAGLHAEPLAEFAVFGLLAFAKDIDRLSELSRRGEWAERWPMRQLAASTVVIIGMGGVGRQVSRLLGAFGTTVVGVQGSKPRGRAEGVTSHVSMKELDDVLPRCDAVVVALPGTTRTQRLFDAERLARLPRHAVLVNVGRGSVLDSAALAEALDEGRLRGAVLDVTELEPLPAGSPLWGRSDVILSPHTAALTVDEDDRIVRLFAGNLRRFLAGEPLHNVVELGRGY